MEVKVATEQQPTEANLFVKYQEQLYEKSQTEKETFNSLLKALRFETYSRETLTKQVAELKKEVQTQAIELAKFSNHLKHLQDSTSEQIFDFQREIQAQINKLVLRSDNNNFILSKNDQSIHHLLEQNKQTNLRINQAFGYLQRVAPLLTHYQISDMMQEFLCLADQKKLVDLDNERVYALAMHQLSCVEIEEQVWEVAQYCSKHKTGLPRFKIGQALDPNYLEQRASLIQSHAQVYQELQEQNKMHIGCLNGTVLKEIVIWRSKESTKVTTRSQLVQAARAQKDLQKIEVTGVKPEYVQMQQRLQIPSKNKFWQKLINESITMNAELIREMSKNINLLEDRVHKIEVLTNNIAQNQDVTRGWQKELEQITNCKVEQCNKAFEAFFARAQYFKNKMNDIHSTYTKFINQLDQYAKKNNTFEKEVRDVLQITNTNLVLMLEQHKNEIASEYVEFFKSRTRIKAEWRAYTDKTSDEIQQLKKLLEIEVSKWDGTDRLDSLIQVAEAKMKAIFRQNIQLKSQEVDEAQYKSQRVSQSEIEILSDTINLKKEMLRTVDNFPITKSAEKTKNLPQIKVIDGYQTQSTPFIPFIVKRETPKKMKESTGQISSHSQESWNAYPKPENSQLSIMGHTALGFRSYQQTKRDLGVESSSKIRLSRKAHQKHYFLTDNPRSLERQKCYTPEIRQKFSDNENRRSVLKLHKSTDKQNI